MLTFAFGGFSCFGFFGLGRGLGRSGRFGLLLGRRSRGGRNSVDFLRFFGLLCGGGRCLGGLLQHHLILDVVLVEEERVAVVDANAVSALHLDADGPRLVPAMAEEWVVLIVVDVEHAMAQIRDDLSRRPRFLGSQQHWSAAQSLDKRRLGTLPSFVGTRANFFHEPWINHSTSSKHLIVGLKPIGAHQRKTNLAFIAN